MSIKKLLLISYIFAGLIIAIFTAFMTFYIIDVPIGMKMFSKIVITISIVLPVIAISSYLIGSYFSRKFTDIQNRLILISNEDFTIYDKNEYLDEIADIHKILNTVAVRLDNSINELKEKNSELTWMIRSFTHDYRTPLTIIQGNIEAIEDGLVPNENLPLVLEKIKYETYYMNELLSDVLQFIQSMKNVVKKEKIQLKEFIDKEIFVLLEPNANVTLINAMKEEDDIVFTKTDLKKIIVNLFDNSIKFTNKGSITISLENDSLIIKDTGIGIDIKECEVVFKPFYTVDESKNRTKSGFGLGLAIAKNLAQKNSYILKCNSDNKDGCEMVLSLVI